MNGSMRRRGKKSWELKFDIGVDGNGKRIIAYRSFKGTKADAGVKLAEYVAAAGKQEYTAPSKATLADFLPTRIEAWLAQQAIGRKTAERYRQIADKQIIPHLGKTRLQNLGGLALGEWHGKLLSAGLSPQTVRHAHRLLAKALREAKVNGLTSRNAATEVKTPSVPDREVTILEREQVDMVMGRLETHHDATLRPMVALALYAGLRRGEVLALRWNAVDVEAGRLGVVASLEQVDDGPLTFKVPKTKAGRRIVSMPDRLIAALRAHRVYQLELRLKLGLGKMPDDALLFADLEGNPLSPRAISKRWAAFAKKAGVGSVRFHDLRHTSASLLHDAKVSLAVTSKRLGHTKISTTLNLYTHIFQGADDAAAAALNATLSGGKSAG